MPFIMLIIIGAAAGFVATRVMKLNTDVPTTIAIGVFGALIGGLMLRLLLASLGAAPGFIGALLGAFLLIWLWKIFMR
jgi:uncharacterized membrane protein YeaQ/YmgE (transglycosylase-associated protein family)